jgi:hypothetical protein
LPVAERSFAQQQMFHNSRESGARCLANTSAGLFWPSSRALAHAGRTNAPAIVRATKRARWGAPFAGTLARLVTASTITVRAALKQRNGTTSPILYESRRSQSFWPGFTSASAGNRTRIGAMRTESLCRSRRMTSSSSRVETRSRSPVSKKGLQRVLAGPLSIPRQLVALALKCAEAELSSRLPVRASEDIQVCKRGLLPPPVRRRSSAARSTRERIPVKPSMAQWDNAAREGAIERSLERRNASEVLGNIASELARSPFPHRLLFVPLRNFFSTGGRGSITRGVCYGPTRPHPSPKFYRGTFIENIKMFYFGILPMGNACFLLETPGERP